jgi:hypothetical protein
MLGIVLIVLFIMTMFIWLLSLLGAGQGIAQYSPWLAWFACLFLGIWLALYSTGVIVVQTSVRG